MSNLPPNVPGDQPPGTPPPPGPAPYGAQPPPYGQQPPPSQPFSNLGPSQTANLPPGIAATQLADWPTRALGFLIDLIPIIIFEIIFYILAAVISFFLFYLIDLVNIALFLFYGYQVGTFGSTPGMRLMGLKCVSIKDGQIIGVGNGILRAIFHIVDDVICFVGWFFPFWDAQRQTIADKLASTIVITVPKQPFSIMPPQGS